MFRRSFLSLGTMKLSKATRLQLGTIHSEFGKMTGAAGSSELWGNQYYGLKYPMATQIFFFFLILAYRMGVTSYQQYRDMIIFHNHICLEDVFDRCLRPIPGIYRLKSVYTYSPQGVMEYRDPTPLEWLPYELKLGSIKQASL
eukprot:PhM_4_TR8048/c0_g1_i1/m.106644